MKYGTLQAAGWSVDTATGLVTFSMIGLAHESAFTDLAAPDSIQ